MSEPIVAVPHRMSRIEKLMHDLENPGTCEYATSIKTMSDARQLILDLLGMSEKPVGEQIYAVCVKQCEDATASEGEPNDLRTMTRFAKQWLPECFPASDVGQVHFARAVCESLISAAEAHLRRIGQPVEVA